jgi:hypothetical protein
MTKYDPRTRYYPAFDDGDLFVDSTREFTDSERCKSAVQALNKREKDRLKTGEPDTTWFVAKVVGRITIEWTPKKPAEKVAPKKRVVRKTATK